MEIPPTSLAILPVGGAAWLCRCIGREVLPLVEAPGADDAHYAFALDGSALAVLDMGRKRAGLFSLRIDAPLLDPLLPFSNLPKGCIGHAIATTGSNLIVGGHSDRKESLWSRSPRTGGKWRSEELPEGVGAKGKAIDGLLLDGPRVIAVDDLLPPKWLIVYQQSDLGELQDPVSVRLPDHISYERIHAAALGPKWIGLISKGTAHGSRGSFLSLLARDTFQEQAVWLVRTHTGLFDEGSSEDLSSVLHALLNAKDLGFVGETLQIACGPHGLLSANLGRWTPPPPELPPLVEILDPRSGSRRMVEDHSAPVKAGGPGPPLFLQQVPGLTSVDKLVIPTPSNLNGVFATGSEKGGRATHVWVSAAPPAGPGPIGGNATTGATHSR